MAATCGSPLTLAKNATSGSWSSPTSRGGNADGRQRQHEHCQYEFYVLNEEKVNVDELLAMEAEERNAVLADAANWTECAKTTDNAADVTTNDLGDATGRIFKLNVSRTDTTGWAACVRIYEPNCTLRPSPPSLLWTRPF